MKKIATLNQIGEFTSHQYGSGGWSFWSNQDFPINSFFREDWRIRFYIIFETVEDERDASPPRSDFTLVFDHGKDAFDSDAPPAPLEQQIAAALWVKEHASLLESRCQPVLKLILDQTLSEYVDRTLEPEQAIHLERELKQRGYGLPGAEFRMTHPYGLKFMRPLPDGRVIFSIQFDWACDEANGPVLYFDRDRLITHNFLPEVEWRTALAAEGLPNYRNSTAES